VIPPAAPILNDRKGKRQVKTFDDIVIRLEMMETIADYMESAIDDAILASGMSDKAAKVQHLFYILLEQITQTKEEATEIAGHVKVCNAIFAVNRVNELQAEIDRLRAAKV